MPQPPDQTDPYNPLPPLENRSGLYRVAAMLAQEDYEPSEVREAASPHLILATLATIAVALAGGLTGDQLYLSIFVFAAAVAANVSLAKVQERRGPSTSRTTATCMLNLAATVYFVWVTGGPLSPLVLLFFLGIITTVLSTTSHTTRLMAGSVAIAGLTLAGHAWLVSPPLTLAELLGITITVICLLAAGVTLQIFLEVMRDTDRKRRRAVAERGALDALNVELERTSRLRDEFLANMSHELRTPLNAVLGLSEALQAEVYGSLTPKQHESLRTIETSGTHLLDLINDVLDLAKIDAGKMELDLQLVDLQGLINDTLAIIQPEAEAQQHQLSHVIDPATRSIHADLRRLRQILLNLLGNAVKFTSTGGKIGVEVGPGPDPATVGITVWDTGVGIPAKELQQIFEPFLQLEGGLTRRAQGTGLGLPMVARLAALHGGRVEVESEVGRGSSFTVVLPIKPAGLGPSAAQHPDSTGSVRLLPAKTEGGAPLLLVVASRASTTRPVRALLREEGYPVVVASSRTEAQERALRMRPDLVLVAMEGDDGAALETIAALRQLPRGQRLTLLAMGEPEHHSRCLAAGADGCLTAPLQLDALEHLIRELTGRM